MSGDAHLLTLADIADLRAYERERDEFRRRVIAVKKLRRVAVGPIISCTFENRLTMRFQVQEMARAERMTSDAQVLHELDVYNRLLPAPGELSATLFLELTDEAALRHWLPALVGVERSLLLRVGDPEAPGGPLVVPGSPDVEHEAQLTRETVTAAVHYVRFRLDPEAVEAFGAGPVRLAVDHPAYPEGREGTPLGAGTLAELLADLRGVPATW